MVQRDILEAFNDEQLKVYVVWTPVLQEDDRQAAVSATEHVVDKRAVHFWDADKSLGFSLGKVVKLPRERRLAWDVYFAFDASAKWDDVVPEPAYWMHQLGTDQRTLVGEKLRTAVENLLKASTTASRAALSIFEKRILAIFNAKTTSSCTECHLNSVDLKDYIHPSQEKTFGALVSAGLVDTEKPDDSKILAFISRRPEKPSLITENVRKQEYDAFRAWIRAAVKEPGLLAAESDENLGPSVPDEVIRHARKDRVLASFIDNIWSEVARCAGCHSPDQNQKQVEEHGEQVSWIKLRDPQATLSYMIEAELIDANAPEESLLLLKPTMQVQHGGGQKMMIGDRSYRQFRRFIDDYAAVVGGEYKSPEDLPEQDGEVSVATSMSNGIWFKLTDVPDRYDKQLLQVDLYRRDGEGWSEARWATADRVVYGKGRLWQQTLSLIAPRGSKRAEEIRRGENLPADEYLVKIYIDAEGKLTKDARSGLGDEEFVGEVVVKSKWPRGYGRMTAARFPER